MGHPLQTSGVNMINTPPRFEDEYPEEAEVLMAICNENAKTKRYSKSNKPLCLDSVEPIQGEVKIGRNDQCPCGSEKKFKKCCINA